MRRLPALLCLLLAATQAWGDATEPTADIEGASLQQDDELKQTGGFVGSDSDDDTSSELVEDREQSQAPDGQ